ncbi:MAG: hypothetical protein RR825_07445, partial [Ruthenibacterium sp.]
AKLLLIPSQGDSMCRHRRCMGACEITLLHYCGIALVFALAAVAAFAWFSDANLPYHFLNNFCSAA